MSRGAWELASGAKESGLSALFKGASLVSQQGETVSALKGLQDKTALLYFASQQVKSCRRFNELLGKFYDIARQTDDSIVVIFVSNDEAKEDQLELFRGMHADWLMLEWSTDLEDIADSFKVEKIPSLLVISREGRAVVEDARDQVYDTMDQEPAPDAKRLKADVDSKCAEWRRMAGDWRASAGHTLGSAGGAGSSSSSAAFAAPASGGSGGFLGTAPSGPPGSSVGSDREALRAARLAALEKRMSGGTAADFPSFSGASGSASSSGMPAAASSAGPSAAAPALSSAGPHIASLGGDSYGGSGTFASGAAGAAGLGGVAYTLAGGRVELPPAPAPAAGGYSTPDDLVSDMASDGAGSGADVADLPDAPTEAEAIAQIVAMGFPADAARHALQASNGDIDTAVAHMLGD